MRISYYSPLRPCDYSNDQVTAALRLTDGALLVVDCISGKKRNIRGKLQQVPDLKTQSLYIKCSYEPDIEWHEEKCIKD